MARTNPSWRYSPAAMQETQPAAIESHQVRLFDETQLYVRGSQGKVELSVETSKDVKVSTNDHRQCYLSLWLFFPELRSAHHKGFCKCCDHIAEIDRSLADAKSIPGSKQMTALRIPKNSPNHFFLFSNVVKTEEAFSSCQVLHKRPWSTRCWADNNLNTQSFCQQGACN